MTAGLYNEPNDWVLLCPTRTGLVGKEIEKQSMRLTQVWELSKSLGAEQVTA